MEDEQLWDRLLDEQSALFRKTIKKNAELEARVIELERELSVWKVAFTSNDQEKIALKKQVTKLERNIGSLRDDNPLVLCLIDGDGNVFSPDLVSQGRAGGSQAAQLLTKGITDYLVENEDSKNEPSSISGRAQIWVSIYYNKSGLQEIFTSLQLCTVEQFEAFVMGFNQASPLFTLADVGNGKEAADTKIKECLRVFTRFPQTSKVFFGGGHDNGYASTLNSLNNEGLLDKIILLRGYKDVAFEVKALHLPSVEFAGLFMTEKIPYNHLHKKNNAPLPADNDKRTPRLNTSSLPASPSKPKPKLKQQSDSSTSTKYNPPACNFYYLAMCKAGAACRYGHDYDLDPQELTIMRVDAKKSPCGMANRNQTCPLADRCPLGHVCPSGSKCKFHKAGKCKFSGMGMHDTIGGNVSPEKSTRARRDDSYSLSSGGSGIRPITPGVPSLALGCDGAMENPGVQHAVPFDEWFSRYYAHYQRQTTPTNKDVFSDSLA